jgi:hypothetical protein
MKNHGNVMGIKAIHRQVCRFNKTFVLFYGLFCVHLLSAQPFIDQKEILLKGVTNSNTVWGDYNNDGYLDFVLIGATDSAVVSLIYRNNGDNTYTAQTTIQLTGVISGCAAWGDYNNDGYLDLILTGSISNKEAVTKVYKNKGDNTFEEQIAIQLPGVSNSSAAWGDYDNDGYPDILLTGSTTLSLITKLYHNNGNNTFTEQANTAFTGVSMGNAAWGDYDNDGYLDILLTGGGVTKVYHNSGDNIFTEQTSIVLDGLKQGNAAWGDYDNDGYLDILINGLGNGFICKLYHNNGNNTFTEQTGSSLTAFKTGSVSWGDYDNDGYPDILITGKDNASGKDSKVYHNNRDLTFTELTGTLLPLVESGCGIWGDYDNDGKLDILLAGSGISKIYRNNANVSNTVPSTPDNLQTTIAGTDVTFKWNKATDKETPQNGLSYNLYVYQDRQPTYQRSPLALIQTNNNGRRLIAQAGNIQYSEKGYTLKGLPFGNYLWSVQAVDAGLQGGNFAKEASFTFSILGSVGINVASGQLTNTTVAMEYSLNSSNGIDGKWALCTAPNTSVNFGTGGYDVWVRRSGVTIIDKRKIATIALQAAAPAYAIDYFNETTDRNIELTNEYSTNADMSGASSGTGTTIPIKPGQNLYLRIKSTASAVSSAIQTLVVPNRPGQPYYSIDFINETTNEIVSLFVEYAIYENMKGAISGTGVKIPVTFGQNLYFRVKATDTCFKSLIQTLVVPSIFTEQALVSLSGVTISSIAWGDYDNDGYLDLLVTGLTSADVAISKLYHNNGDRTFTEQTNIILMGVSDGSVAWDDYDNDGYLDILLTGWSGFTDVSKIYHNNGDGTFTEQTNITLEGVSMGSVAWGDYDNDGYSDILLTGSSSQYISKIYHNNGDGTFTEQVGVSLTGVYNSSVAWGDYNNDGYLDILLTGNTGTERVSKIYRNNGNRTFSEMVSIVLPGISDGSVAWGDYDNDSYLDILLTGASGTQSNNGAISKIYRNNGDGTFSEQTGIVLNGVYNSSAAWGDYNNDGYLDILLTGRTGSTGVSKIYKNNRNNNFVEQTTVGLPGVYYGSAAWGDIDNDGDLDMVLTGNSGSTRISKIYNNNRGVVNTAAIAPSNLRAVIKNVNDINFFWSKGTDAETPQNGLSYNLYIYQEAQKNFKRSPLALVQTHKENGHRLIAQIGNIQYSDSGYFLRNLATGNYKWSVQAIDGGLKGGSFASERALHFINLKDVNINVANNQITNTATGMEFSINTVDGIDGTWISCTDLNTSVNFGIGGFDIWVRQSDMPANKRKLATIALQAAPPVYTTDYINEATNEIFLITDEYSTNISMIDAVSGNNLKLSLTPGLNYYFRVKATSTMVASEIFPLSLSGRPAPPVYTIDFINERTIENIKATDEYSVNSDLSSMVSGVGLSIPIIPGQSLYFRTMASATGFKSIIQKMVVPERPAAPYNPFVDDVANTFDWANNSDFTNVTDYEYSIDNGLSWQACLLKPINVGNIDLSSGILKIRVKTTSDHFRGESLSSNAAFTISTKIDHLKEQGIQIYPNPVKNLLIINDLTSKAELKIYSLEGKPMMTFHLNNNNVIDLCNLPNGIYILKIVSNQMCGEAKFVKQ